MHFPSLAKYLLVIFIQHEAIFGIQIFNCKDDKQTVALCVRADQLDPYTGKPLMYGLARAMQAGQTATCEEITIGSLPVDNAACCSSQAHALPKHQDPAPVRKSETYMPDNCSIVPSAPPS
ncbi:hypothetical protein PCASD_13590 [Puccinia coronata f. sp. avenae]|uniref:Uncharacterized protein n=1 Tax=Puccinia coronata f. sp. avenae TaxID=200324 RepID=A0A2N5T5R5_9BASI|nr:hypothetical protein PCASD_13590 [Puccinia coronata f. sp. avenae]